MVIREGDKVKVLHGKKVREAKVIGVDIDHSCEEFFYHVRYKNNRKDVVSEWKVKVSA